MYSNCPKILYSKLYDKMAYANCADPDEIASDQGPYFAIPPSILWKNGIKK